MNTLLDSQKPQLDSSGRKKIKECPCGEDNRNGKFVGFKGHDKYGYCHSCDRTFFPPADENNVEAFIPKPVKPATRPISFILAKLLDGYIVNPLKSNFAFWLCNPGRTAKKQFPFTEEVRASIIEKYKLFGTDKYPNGSALLYIDFAKRIRQIKLIGYNPETGKRIREPKPQVWQPGSKILEDAGESNPNIVPCFYGEHGLSGNKKDVYVFESEVTAMYASPFFPDVVCLATGGKNGCKWTQRSQYSVLIGRKVTFFPDIDAHEEWDLKVKALQADGLNATVSDTIIKAAEAFCLKSGHTIEQLKALKFDLRDLLVYKSLPLSLQNITIKTIDPPSNQLFKIKDDCNNVNLCDPIKKEPEPEKHISSGGPDFDIAEHWSWMKTLQPLTNGHSIRLNSSEFPVCNLKLFITGRLNHIQAFTNYREQGNRPLFIRQVQELRTTLSTRKQTIL